MTVIDEVTAAFRAGPPTPKGERVAVVHGNCQAESLRQLLAAGDVQTVRMPPVHEMTAADLPSLHAWLAEADLFVTQPVRDGYRCLPLGTRELARRTSARVVVFPVIRFAGLYPVHALIRPPTDPSLTPPVVAYHDLRTLAAAAGLPRHAGLTPDTVRAIAADSLAELRAREQRHGAVPVSDLLERASFADMRTINHPGNPVLVELARRVAQRAGLSAVADPGRPLLDGVHAPREPVVIEALGLRDEPRGHWIVKGAPVSAFEVREAHMRWYAEHPDAVAEGLRRHAVTLARLGATR